MQVPRVPGNVPARHRRGSEEGGGDDGRGAGRGGADAGLHLHRQPPPRPRHGGGPPRRRGQVQSAGAEGVVRGGAVQRCQHRDRPGHASHRGQTRGRQAEGGFCQVPGGEQSHGA